MSVIVSNLLHNISSTLHLSSSPPWSHRLCYALRQFRCKHLMCLAVLEQICSFELERKLMPSLHPWRRCIGIRLRSDCADNSCTLLWHTLWMWILCRSNYSRMYWSCNYPQICLCHNYSQRCWSHNQLQRYWNGKNPRRYLNGKNSRRYLSGNNSRRYWSCNYPRRYWSCNRS